MWSASRTKWKEKLNWSRRDICPLIEGQEPVWISVLLPVPGERSCPDICLLLSSPPLTPPPPMLSAPSSRTAKCPLAQKTERLWSLRLHHEPSYPQLCLQFPVSSKAIEPWWRAVCVCVNIRLGKADVNRRPPVKPALWCLFLFFISDFQSKLFKIQLPVYAINSCIPDTFPEDGSLQCPFSRRPCSLSDFGHNINCAD